MILYSFFCRKIPSTITIVLLWIGKSDPIDAFVITDYARAGNIETEPWCGSQFLALKRLTRHRMRKHNVEYGAYYRKKYNEVPKHQHKRALALTSRKFVRLVYGLLARNQLYSGVSLDTSNE